MRAKAAQSIVAPDAQTEALNALIIDALQDIKGKDILLLDMRNLHDAPTDFFIICEGTSNTQVRAMSDNVYKRVRTELDVRPVHTEGSQSGTWILNDYFTVVLHIFHHETRRFYDLERLWGDAKVTAYENI